MFQNTCPQVPNCSGSAILPWVGILPFLPSLAGRAPPAAFPGFYLVLLQEPLPVQILLGASDPRCLLRAIK